MPDSPVCSVCGHRLILLPDRDRSKPLICGTCESAQVREQCASIGIVRNAEWREDVPYCRKNICPSWNEGVCKLDGRRVGYRNFNDDHQTICRPIIRLMRQKIPGAYDLHAEED